MQTISIIPETNVPIDIRSVGRFADDRKRFKERVEYLKRRAVETERFWQEDSPAVQKKQTMTLTRASNTIATIRKDFLEMYAECKISVVVLDKADANLANLWKGMNNIPEKEKFLIQTYIQTLAEISRNLRIKANRN